jgi:hypothetical protein
MCRPVARDFDCKQRVASESKRVHAPTQRQVAQLRKPQPVCALHGEAFIQRALTLPGSHYNPETDTRGMCEDFVTNRVFRH